MPEDRKPSAGSSANPDSALDRWNKPVDWERLQRLDALRRKRLGTVWGSVVAIAVLVLVARLLLVREVDAPEPSSPPPVVTQVRQTEADAPPTATRIPALPTDAKEIAALLSHPENPVVRITTGKGDMLAELFEDKVPNTVANMIALAENGFYKDLSFHRIIPGFMAQGGCPNSKKDASGMPGTGGPGYRFADEFHPELKHVGKGILSMANSGPNTNGSQFFLCFTDTPHLDGKHSVFGKVVAGMDALRELEKIGTQSGTPKSTVRFDIEVVSKQDHSYQVEKL